MDLRTRDTNIPGELGSYIRRQQQKDEESMCDIIKEVEHLREIKDIRDELNIIERVFTDQATVVTQFSAARRQLFKPEELNALKTLEQSIDFRVSKVQKLGRDALAVEDSVSVPFDRISEPKVDRKLTMLEIFKA
jgi:hypothetical protein